MSGLVPKLRFKQDDGSDFPEWEEKELNEIAIRCRVKNNNSEVTRVLTNSAVQGVIDQSEYFDKDIANSDNLTGYYIVQNGDFVYNPRISVSAPVGPIKRNNLGIGVMSPLYTVIRFNSKNTDFYDHFFQSKLWHEYMKSVANYGARHDRMAITTHDFMALPIPFPSLPEQQKIADFLSSIDAKIDAVKRKQDAFERYKKGLMQQIFAQKIRFKQDDGSDFPEWEEKRLGDAVFNITSGLPIDQNTDNTGYKVTRIETISDAKVNLSKVGYINTTNDISEYLLNSGDILFSNINSVKHIGKMALITNERDLYHGMNLLRIIPGKEINSAFLYNYLTSSPLKKHFERVCNQAVSQASINQTELKLTKIVIPSLPEQQKIADFLSSVDAKIDAIKAQIEKLEAFKKGLLQQMFV